MNSTSQDMIFWTSEVTQSLKSGNIAEYEKKLNRTENSCPVFGNNTGTSRVAVHYGCESPVESQSPTDLQGPVGESMKVFKRSILDQKIGLTRL